MRLLDTHATIAAMECYLAFRIERGLESCEKCLSAFCDDVVSPTGIQHIGMAEHEAAGIFTSCNE